MPNSARMSGLYCLCALMLLVMPQCPTCQMHARTTCFDLVPIRAVARDAVVFRHMQMDIFGPIIPGGKLAHNFALIIICSASRYPWAFPLHAPTTKNICDALLNV